MTFILPDNLYRSAPRGRHTPCLHGCVLHVHRAGLVTVDGPTEIQLVDQAKRFLGKISRAAVILQARLESPAGERSVIDVGNKPIEQLPLFGKTDDAA